MSIGVVSILLAILSNLLYHVFQKGFPKGINPFVALSFTYASALITTLILIAMTVEK